MHHHIFGAATLLIIGGCVFGPQAVSAIHDLTVTPDVSNVAAHAQRIDPSQSTRAMLESAIDVTATAAQSGRIDRTLDAFSSSLQRNAHIPDRDVDAILAAAQGPESQQFLRSLASAVKHPESVSAPQSGAGLPEADRDMIARVAQSLRAAIPQR